MVAGLAMLVLALGAVLMVALGASGARGRAEGPSEEPGYPGANSRLEG